MCSYGFIGFVYTSLLSMQHHFIQLDCLLSHRNWEINLKFHLVFRVSIAIDYYYH